MSSLLAVPNDRARADLVTFLQRASRFGDGSVRLAAHGEVATVAVPVTVSSGLLDLGATILGVRAIRLERAADFDAVVSAAAVVEAVEAGAEIEVPAAGTMPAWASVSPPRAGWQFVGEVPADAARIGAVEAATRVERELPQSPGEAVVRRVRRAVWAERLDAGRLSLGACVALDGLGFLAPTVTTVRVTASGGWTRSATALGDVLER